MAPRRFRFLTDYHSITCEETRVGAKWEAIQRAAFSEWNILNLWHLKSYGDNNTLNGRKGVKKRRAFGNWNGQLVAHPRGVRSDRDDLRKCLTENGTTLSLP